MADYEIDPQADVHCRICRYRPRKGGTSTGEFVDAHVGLIDGHARFDNVCPRCGCRNAFVPTATEGEK